MILFPRFPHKKDIITNFQNPPWLLLIAMPVLTRHLRRIDGAITGSDASHVQPRVVKNDGGFAGLFRLDFAGRCLRETTKSRFWLAGTDGVGTKLKVAQQTGAPRDSWHRLGRDVRQRLVVHRRRTAVLSRLRCDGQR